MFKDRECLINLFSHGAILDVGCSQKRFSTSDSVGIDIRRNQNVDILADAQFLPFRECVFDTIVAGEIIEHLTVPSFFLKEAKRVLKLGGTLVITTPNPWSITYVARNFSRIGGSPSELSEHKFLWDIHLIEHFLSACDLKVVRVGYVNAYKNQILKILVKFHPEWSFHIFAICKKPSVC